MPFCKGGRHLWTHFSQSFSDKIEEFLCSSERKFPELFKTHLTFVHSPLLGPSLACQTQTGVFFETPCIYPSKTSIDASLWHIHQIIVAPGHQDWSWLHYAACHHIHEWCHSLRAEDALIVTTGVRWGGLSLDTGGLCRMMMMIWSICYATLLRGCVHSFSDSYIHTDNKRIFENAWDLG